jgi:cytochrome c553
MRIIAVSALLAALLGVQAAAVAAGNPELGQQKAAVCMACHGPDGNSPVLPAPAEPWPKLAGQLPEYIDKQLHDFKAGRRSNVQMSPQAQMVAEADIADIATFFAGQQIKPAEVSRQELLARGEQLFFKGKGRPQVVAACVGCHGFNGVGNRDWAKIMAKLPAILPPAIGGQHASYIVKQLQAYRDGSRSNDPAKVMRDIAARLDDADMAAVAEYVSTLVR